MIYYVYMLLNYESKRKVSYVGYTSNLKKRIILHNSSKGAKFTKGGKWMLIYKKKYLNKSDALKNEYKLKKNSLLRKKFKDKFIKKILLK
ncbi:GIY-YIG nuclease family protein [Pelagibacterales bacterium SAG-MED39]|nr:GIY-YIG nuclease family protein [Pelagibacterales bacterium SAG-MED39]